MFLHLYQGKKSGKFRFKILTDSKQTILKSKKKFKSKKLRKKFLETFFRYSYKLKSVPKHTTRSGLYYFSIIDADGNELARSKKFKKKEERNKRRKKFVQRCKQQNKNLPFKNIKAVDKERQILKTGSYPLGHYDYSIFLSSNGKHYFTFKDKDGKTALLNSNIQGFKTLDEADAKLNEVINSAKDSKLYEVKETKNGKFFFYLYNKSGQKIAKSFFYKNKIDAENVIAKFIGSTPKVEVKDSKENKTIQVKANAVSLATPDIKSSTKKNSDVKYEANSLLTDREKYLKQKELEKIKLEKELEERREKRRLQRLEKEKLALESSKNKAAITESEKATTAYYQEEEDGFFGCLKWFLGFISLLALILLLFWLFKGCNKASTSEEPIAHEAVLSDSTTLSSDTISNSTIKGDKSMDGTSGRMNEKEESNTTENQSKENQSENYSDLSCGCSNSIGIFKIPSNSEAKSIKSLISNPQFGSLPGNSGSDLLDDLNYQARLSRSNSSFLKYLFQSMGYDGLHEVNSKDISLEVIPTGSKGIMGFGKYNGYKYVSLDLNKSQLKAFKISSPSGCTIYMTKEGGNFFYPCE